MDVVDWLLDGEPAIRWQVLRDLVDAPAEQVAAERAIVETEGWGAGLLTLRDPDGQWDGRACFPWSIVDDWRAGIEPDFSNGQPWTSTLPTLVLLRDLGLDPTSAAARDTIPLVAANCRWENDGQAFFDGEIEPCINGRTLSIGAYLGADIDGLVSGLLEYELSLGRVAVAAARRRGEEYLLERQLFRRKSTGEVPVERWLQFSWPPRWHCDVLRALDHFRRIGEAPDDRIAAAVQLVRDKRRPDGTWSLENTHPERPSSSSRTAPGNLAGGTRCERFASSTGTTSGGKPRSPVSRYLLDASRLQGGMDHYRSSELPPSLAQGCADVSAPQASLCVTKSISSSTRPSSDGSRSAYDATRDKMCCHARAMSAWLRCGQPSC